MGFFPFVPLVPPGNLLATALAGQTVPGALTLTGLLSTQLGITNSGANITSSGAITTTAVQSITSNGNVDVNFISGGLRVAEGTNAKQGLTAAMVAGTITVANTSVTASSRILLTSQATGGTVGGENVSTRTAGTSFTITSTNAADTSQVGFQIFEPG